MKIFNTRVKNTLITACIFLVAIAVLVIYNFLTLPKLKEFPIQVGGMAFNDGRVHTISDYQAPYEAGGFGLATIDTWCSEDLIVTTDGKFKGTFKTTYDDKTEIRVGASTPEYEERDVLFIIIRATYVYTGFGDTASYDLSDLLPFVAQQSDERSATFNVSGTFNIPRLFSPNAGPTESMPLRDIQVNLTWVRVYNIDNVLYYQILPGDADRYYPNIPVISFNKQPTDGIQSRFWRSPELIQQDELRYKGIAFPTTGAEFNFAKWIKENVKW